MSDADCTPGREPRSVAASCLKIRKMTSLLAESSFFAASILHVTTEWTFSTFKVLRRPHEMWWNVAGISEQEISTLRLGLTWETKKIAQTDSDQLLVMLDIV